MADQFIDAAATSSGTSPFSILNKLPTKRIDAAIAAAAQSGIPEQGEQTGGYTSAYAHLSHLPLLPLYSQAQHDILAKQQARKERLVKDMDANDPDKLLSGGQKAFLSVLGLLSDASGIVSMKRWERRLVGANVMSTKHLMEQNRLIVFTRWTVPTTQGRHAKSVNSQKRWKTHLNRDPCEAVTWILGEWERSPDGDCGADSENM
jgi:hypothetical protein